MNDAKEYYKKLYRGYYPFSFFRDKYLLRLVKKFIPPGKRVLEIGCGTGRLLSQLSADYESYGIDSSSYAISEARKIVRPGTKLFVHNIQESLSALNGTFSGILMINVLEHLPNPKNALQNINSLLEKSGYLFLHLPVMSNSLQEFLLALFYKDESHIFLPSYQELQEILKETGFIIVYETSATLLPFSFLLPFNIRSRLVLESLPAYFGIIAKE